MALVLNAGSAAAAKQGNASRATGIALPSSAYAGLNSLQRQILQRLARQGVPAGAAPPPAVCFAPGTDPAYQSAVEKRLYGTSGNLALFRLSTSWSSTATNGSVAAQGTPITLTWSIVPDGTSIPGSSGEATSNSNLKAFLNGLYTDQTTWQALFQQVFDRWSELSGVKYVFEANDDGAAFPQSGVSNGSSGLLGVRGDLRISGHVIDGAGGVLAYNFYPNSGDMVIDTGDGAVFGNTANNSRAFRNTIAHEHGHGLGFDHVCPVDHSKLMEPFLSTAFDGPQLDDILAVQRAYGDAREKNSARNNDTPANAADLGTLSLTTTTFDTLSIDGTSDTDVYRFTPTGSGDLVSVTLRPTGATYLEGAQNGDGSCPAGTSFNSQPINDLTLELRGADGTTILSSANANGAGGNEVISSVTLPSGSGPFYLRVTGGTVDNVQMYALDITLANSPQSGPNFVVTSNSDGLTNGVCDTIGTGDGCTLREAITAANANADGSIITFSGVTGTLQLESALPGLSTNIGIQGPGANLLTVRGEGAGDQYRIFDTSAVVSLSGLTLSNGSVAGNGGAIRNSGTLAITSCALSDNSATNGGGIYTTGALTIVNSTLNSNSATGQGGGLWSSTNLSGLTCTVRNCTLYGNTAGSGGGLYNGAGLSTLENSTVTHNTAPAGQGSGVASSGDSNTRSEVKNSIVAGNMASDVDYVTSTLNSFQSNGYNLIGSGNAVGEFVESGNQSGLTTAQLKIGSLANNGGPTQTVALSLGSPAINSGDPTYTTPLTTDQRGSGYPRVLGGRLDIGAFEVLSLIIDNVTVTEGNSGFVNANFTVTLSSASPQTVTVKYATAVSSSAPATAGVDYVAVSSTTLTFAPGETSKTITVQVKGDTLDEVDERFSVNLSNSTIAAIFDKEAFCTITDDDAPPSLKVNDVSVTEGNSGTTNATFTVSLSAASGKTVTVKYVTVTPGSIPATVGIDYVAVPLTALTFAPGETSKQFTVLVNGDTLDEDNERFAVNLSSAGNAAISDKEGFCTILDDDAVPSLRINDVSLPEGNSGTTAFNFTVTLSAASGKTVTVKYQTTSPGALIATPGTDYVAVLLTTLTFAPGETSKQVTVLVNGDTMVEGTERFVVKLSSSANATVADSEGFGTITNDDVAALLFEEDVPSE